ncbi:MAG: Crp/Fnr family transcriptional regulator [Rectinema sp.]|nr:Crp/Fnr family transcriptional regulator [Rectinema sp.]
MQSSDIARLGTAGIFKTTDIERLADLLRTSRWQELKFRKGELLLLQGCIYTSLHILVEGNAWAEMSDEEGHCIRVETFAPVEALATAVLFSARPILPVTVGAQTDCRVIAFPKQEILNFCLKEKTILEAYLADAGLRLQFLSERLQLMEFATLRERIVHWLLKQAYKSTCRFAQINNEDAGRYPPITVKVEPSFEKLADLMGVARPSLSRELSHMRKEGLIGIQGRTITIPDIELLKALRKTKARRR